MYEKAPITIRKSRIYYVLFVLLTINLAFLTYIYFYFLRDASSDHYSKNVVPSAPFITTRLEKSALRQLPSASRVVSGTNRSFVIDYANNVFLKDGQPFSYVSGSLHYFRVPRVYWRDRIRKFKAAGLNAICTYVEWSSHEPRARGYEFSGDNDLEYFIQLVAEEGLLLILRPGPYVCAERDFGGLPPWLLTLYPDIRLRTNDTDYENEVKIWLNVLFGKVQKYLYGNGGPIIMVQVENEYGSFGACNLPHKIWLRDELRNYVRGAAVLFTTDGYLESYLKCGTIPEVYATVDFGASVNVTQAFNSMRQFAPQGPLVNSEFYPGWLSHWQQPMARVNTTIILKAMKQMLDMKASFNFYMFFGGTNFGFTSGANANNYGDDYQPQLTSYDYDAPLNEAGDPTSKYYEIRKLISQYYPLPDVPVPQPTPKGKYGAVRMKAALSLFNDSYIEDKITLASPRPKTFEEMNLNHGYVMYETILPNIINDPPTLYVSNLRDRAIVYVDRVPAGILDRAQRISSIPLLAHSGQTLSLLVENQGRINFGDSMKDTKGLNTPLLNGRPLSGWKMTGLPFEKISWIYKLPTSTVRIPPPVLYVGELVLPQGEIPLDTYVDLSGWGKGVIFVNDFNLGRYWPSIGSQVTLYVPGCYLRASPHVNKIVVLETEFVAINEEIVFTDVPILDRTPPSIRNAF